MAKKYGFWVRWILRRAGWKPNVRRTVPWKDLPDIPLFPAAERVLVELFGLTVGSNGPGKDCGRSRLTFDPRLLRVNVPEVVALSTQMGVRLYPLGEVDDDDALLLIDENDHTYMWFDELPTLVAYSFDEALERMLLGKKYEADGNSKPGAEGSSS